MPVSSTRTSRPARLIRGDIASKTQPARGPVARNRNGRSAGSRGSAWLVTASSDGYQSSTGRGAAPVALQVPTETTSTTTIAPAAPGTANREAGPGHQL